VSENAWRLSSAGYSSMFIMVGDQVTVENLLKGIIIASGNDACVALAEGIAGTEDEFAILMTAKAKEIGMENTNFANASGLNHTENISTVRDIMIMSNYLIKTFPEKYKYFSEKEFTWDRTGGEPISQGNRNPLLYKNLGADGIKTGYLAVEKYSLASSVYKNGRRLIAVGSGFDSKQDRSRESAKLLTWGLTNFNLIEIAKSKTPIENVDVWLGKKDNIDVYCRGQGWNKGRVNFNEMVDIFFNSKINVNFTSSSNVINFKNIIKIFIKKNGYKFQLNSFSEIILNAKIIFQKKTYQIKGRIFEITGAGGFLLTEKADFLEKYFNIGEEIDTFENYSELKDKIKFYLKNKDLRKEIARKGQDRILRDHTYSQRLNDIFNKIMKNNLDE
jgi:hypothetical protein